MISCILLLIYIKRGKIMRLRNIPHADEFVANHEKAILENQGKDFKGHWKQEFGNNNPIHTEIGMGKGQFILTLAKQNPDINYIGIERYTSVLLRALEKYETEEFSTLENIRFICMDANNLCNMFEEQEVSQIYLNFSDPWPKSKHASRRLTSRNFLNIYDKILQADGTIEFKTDNRPLFDFSLYEVSESKWNLDQSTFDLHHNPDMMVGNVMTEYEEKFSSMGNPIHKLIISRIN